MPMGSKRESNGASAAARSARFRCWSGSLNGVFLIAVLIIPLLAGCTAFSGYPNRVTAPEDDLKVLQTKVDADAIIACLEAAPSAALECRNQLISARVYAVDVSFTQFERKMFEQTREAGFAATLTTLGLNTAGALATGGASQVLSGIAGVVTGSREAFGKEVLAERTLVVIHSAMRANRVSVLAKIRHGLKRSVAEYPVGVGLSDVEEYYFAGTVLGALVGITKAVEVQATQAEQRLSIATGMSQSEAAKALSLYFDDPTITDEEKLTRLKAIQAAARAENLGDITVTSFIADTSPQAEEQKASSIPSFI